MLDGVYLDARPRGWVLVIHNYDRPGVIGNMGTVLGKHNVNINRLQLGLPSSGGDKAISFINIDSPAPDDVLEAVRKIENILVVKQVKFDA
jgi:D-3-phosphoglycerate dehydrogenase